MYQHTFFVEMVCNEKKVIIQFWAYYKGKLTTRSIFITVSICHLLVGEYLKGFRHQMSLFLIFHILKFLARLITKIWVLTTETKKFSNFPPQGQWLTTTALRRPPEKTQWCLQKKWGPCSESYFSVDWTMFEQTSALNSGSQFSRKSKSSFIIPLMFPVFTRAKESSMARLWKTTEFYLLMLWS